MRYLLHNRGSQYGNCTEREYHPDLLKNILCVKGTSRKCFIHNRSSKYGCLTLDNWSHCPIKSTASEAPHPYPPTNNHTWNIKRYLLQIHDTSIGEYSPGNILHLDYLMPTLLRCRPISGPLSVDDTLACETRGLPSNMQIYISYEYTLFKTVFL